LQPARAAAPDSPASCMNRRRSMLGTSDLLDRDGQPVR
jgi:hypothetical protein